MGNMYLEAFNKFHMEDRSRLESGSIHIVCRNIRFSQSGNSIRAANGGTMDLAIHCKENAEIDESVANPIEFYPVPTIV